MKKDRRKEIIKEIEIIISHIPHISALQFSCDEV
jgi:hypothetical protein